MVKPLDQRAIEIWPNKTTQLKFVIMCGIVGK